MRWPAHPLRTLALLAGGAWGGHIVTTYVQETYAPPLVRLDKAVQGLNLFKDKPEALTPHAGRACDKAWNALAALDRQNKLKAQRADFEEDGGAFLHDYAKAQISLKCVPLKPVVANNAAAASSPR